jgi:hypothetical protein
MGFFNAVKLDAAERGEPRMAHIRVNMPRALCLNRRKTGRISG